MLSNDSIINTFTIMTNISNSLDALGKTYTNTEIVSKTCKFLLKIKEEKVMAIQKDKDLIKLSLENLIGSLMTHEITMEKQEQEESSKKNSAFKIVHHNDNDDIDHHEGIEEDMSKIQRNSEIS